VAQLERAGADVIAIPCNSAHLWYDEMAAQTCLPILHIVDATIDALAAQGVTAGPIGVMGTAATLRFELYQGRLEARGYRPLVPTWEQVDDWCMPATRLVKANRLEEAYDPAARCVGELRRRGAGAVLLACTELPLAIPHRLRGRLGIPLIDSIDSLAMAAIRWFQAGSGADRGAAHTHGILAR
jgi:aspartate racemase